METLRPQSGFLPEAKNMPGRVPRTPPYTPLSTKRRFERSDSPASISSIHPAETTSPAKKAAKRDVPSGVKVEELAEGDIGYITDVDDVFPEELEEATSDESEEDTDAESVESDTGISERFEQLDFEDSEEAEFEKKRREKHLRRRTNSRVFKRTHSQSIKSEAEVTDEDAMPDHDLTSSARRLKRRTQGPDGIFAVFDDAPKSSPEPRSETRAEPIPTHEDAQHSEEDDSDSDSSSEEE